ncbi:MAG: aminoacyl-tRNA hydrolase [Bacteroidia bacterium]|nr:aminoacyl-tRNA hydrolase [Bacteroidia bacterium]
MKFLIFGLGNMDAEYMDTRHNVGFDVTNALAEDRGVSFDSDKYAHVASAKFKGKTLVLIQPTTYMNVSGKAVSYWSQKEKVPLERCLVVTDDLSLPFGKIRLRPKGGDAGHNGLKDIIEVMGTNVYPRLRFGIGNDFDRGGQVNFVLGKWNDTEKKDLDTHIKRATDAIKSFVSIGMPRTMSQYNK